MNKKRVLIIGSNSFLGKDLLLDPKNFDVTKIRRPFEGLDTNLYNSYDIILNFCIQNKSYFSLLSEDEMIDVNIAKALKGDTKLVFMSSRKVYGSNIELTEYKETDKTASSDFYSQNKINIENRLNKLLDKNLLCLRVSNIISGEKNICNNEHCFMSWLYDEFIKKNKVTVTIDKNSKRDFITKTYFNNATEALILNDATGIYNIGAGFGITIEELLKNIIDVEYLDFIQQETKSEQFILNCDKLHKFIKPLQKDDLLKECSILGENIKNIGLNIPLER